jgi:hypothetical protein
VSVVQQFGGSLAQTLQGVGPGVRRGEQRQATAPVLVSEQLPGDLWHQGFLVLLGRDRPPPGVAKRPCCCAPNTVRTPERKHVRPIKPAER